MIIKAISSLLISLLISLGVSGAAEMTPQEAADEFFAGLTDGNQQTMESYMDNEYVNFLVNVKGSDEDMDRLENALFKNFSYRITDSAVKGDVAVCKVEVNNSDFSDIIKKYEKASYKYVMDNLYSDNATDKEKLNAKCLDLYIQQLEKTAEGEPACHSEIFLPMESDGYGGWRVILTDEMMQTVLGGLTIPEGEGGDR